MGGISDWINRQRHNRGFGIQSPSTFFFVTQVLKEKLPYYAYPILEEIAQADGTAAKLLKELFRITNHHQPTSIIAVGSHAAACAMAMAKPSVPIYSISTALPSRMEQALLGQHNSKIFQGDVTQMLKQAFKETGDTGIVYISNSPERQKLFEMALQCTKDDSIIVIDGIRDDKATMTWWKSVIEDSRTIITFDFYNRGLLLFNKNRFKQHYTLKR